VSSAWRSLVGHAFDLDVRKALVVAMSRPWESW
jgi:hypothetical protein